MEKKFKFIVSTKDEVLLTEAYYLSDLMDHINVISEYSADEILHELSSTGFFDDDGEEIYEGSILSNSFQDAYPNENSCVVWHNNQWMLVTNESYRPMSDNCGWSNMGESRYGGIKLVGNIHLPVDDQHYYYIKVSGLWQKTTKDFYEKCTSLPKFYSDDLDNDLVEFMKKNQQVLPKSLEEIFCVEF